MKRRTIQRALVLSAVHHLKNHPTADEVYQYAAQHTPTISRGTVYRNLAQLEEEKAIRRIPIPNGPDRFDCRTDDHYHMVCVMCGRFEDAPVPYWQRADQELSQATGWQCTGHTIVFQGLCKEGSKHYATIRMQEDEYHEQV